MTRFYHNSRYSRGPKAIPFRSIFIILAIFTLKGLFLTSCEEDPTIIGKELLPGKDFVEILSTDTIRPVSFTMYDDSVRSDSPSVSYLGNIWDPYFGTTTASFVSQLRLAAPWDGGEYTIDSMSLSLEFSIIKGAAEGTHTLSLFEIATELSTDKIYYSNEELPLTGFRVDLPLPALRDDTINNIEIKFTDLRFAERLLSDTSKLFHSNKIPDFRSFFKGLYFTLTSAGDPLMVSMSLLFNTYYKNYFTIYFSDSEGESKEYFFILDATKRNASFNLYSHDFSTADPDKSIKFYDNMAYRDTLTYIQALNGVYTRIVFPGLKILKESGNMKNIAVNKASLTVPFYTDNDIYKPSNVPGILYLRYRTVTGEKPFVSDYSVDQSHTFYDGTPDTTKGTYHFNIATFVQEYFEDKTENILPELEIIQAGTRNVILRANDNSVPVKFDFTYTRF